MQNDALSKLGTRLRGNIMTPGSGEYEAAREVYNGMIDRQPRAIIRCADVTDVRETVLFARQEFLTVAIRVGAHNGVGLGVCDNGLVIGLSAMKGVRVDRARCAVSSTRGAIT
jgi:hypothetical protein